MARALDAVSELPLEALAGWGRHPVRPRAGGPLGRAGPAGGRGAGARARPGPRLRRRGDAGGAGRDRGRVHARRSHPGVRGRQRAPHLRGGAEPRRDPARVRCRAAGFRRSPPAPSSSRSGRAWPATSTARITTATAPSAGFVDRLALLTADGRRVAVRADARAGALPRHRGRHGAHRPDRGGHAAAPPGGVAVDRAGDGGRGRTRGHAGRARSEARTTGPTRSAGSIAWRRGARWAAASSCAAATRPRWRRPGAGCPAACRSPSRWTLRSGC